ncbi:uncharacterized protein F4817DRAFT_163834 [Daldinia loculata]|uniref:uncharacterized protein n=1 Tax=Daldinia loculata TaxID=103429 RepID=UPI0020C5AE40|nr:uncharacterized protein F4817DRAFT_163834 [Daldinia loculata]KAI1645835.1 hypothetical protein F4817DRAFT_163834 [Daldinia loculata]
MAIYHIRVRNYHWAHQNIVVQSPILNLDTYAPALIVRPLEGVNINEPRIINNVSDLNDDILEDEYQAEAHGVFISTDHQRTDHFPVWVTVHGHECGENKVHVANLTAFEASSVSITDVCWIPRLEAPDGSLYTAIGAPRKTFRTIQVLAIIQQLGKPREARLVLVDPGKLDSYKKIGDDQKRNIFDIQHTAIRTNSKPSEPLLDAYRVFASPYRHDYGRLTLGEIIEEDLEIPRSSNSDCGSQGLSDSSDDDDDSLYTKPRYVSIVDAKTRPYDCDCKYADLLPTCFNPRPSHRHRTDDECFLGSSHIKHCIFADHAPDCVISSSKEIHEHCIHAPPWEVNQPDSEGYFEESYNADADILFEKAEMGVNDTLSPTDPESTTTDLLFMDF